MQQQASPPPPLLQLHSPQGSHFGSPLRHRRKEPVKTSLNGELLRNSPSNSAVTQKPALLFFSPCKQKLLTFNIAQTPDPKTDFHSLNATPHHGQQSPGDAKRHTVFSSINRQERLSSSQKRRQGPDSAQQELSEAQFQAEFPHFTIVRVLERGNRNLHQLVRTNVRL